jgi:hypothetical protein
MLIDAHIHLGGPDRGDGKTLAVEELIAEMDACGVDKAVVFPFNQPQDAFIPANDYIAKAVKEYPDRLIGFARLNPHDQEKALVELDRIYELGLKGVKLHPAGQDFTFDNTTLHQIAEKALDYDLPLIFDTGKPQSQPEHLEKFAKQHPDNTIIMAHMRGDFIPAVLACPNMYVQTTSMPRPEVILKAVEEIGPERIMMGSDYPYLSMQAEVEKIQQLEIPGEARKQLLGETAKKLLGA